MQAVITLVDLAGGGIGFSVQSQKQAGDSGVTDTGYLVHSLTQTLQHIAIAMPLAQSSALDFALAQHFIRRPALNSKGENHDS